MPNRVRNTPPAPPERVIRDPEFAKRFEQACEGNPLIPPKHSGRGSWVQRELKSRFSEEVTPETIRKWFSGEAKPRPDKLAKLAELLQVDVAWLSLGVSNTLQPRERKARNAMADGAVNLIAGLIQMDGGSVSFPEKADGAVDMHVIIKGGMYPLHISLGEPEGKGLKFSVPTTYQDLLVLGVVREGFTVDIYELTSELIEDGHRHGGSITVTASVSDKRLRRIDTFAKRL